MKKSLLALAVLGAFAGAASAQSSVTLFGVVDLSANQIKNGAASTQTLQSNQLNSNRIGFRGIEDLGGGLKAGFWLEAAMSNETGNVGGGNGVPAPANGASIFNRRSTVSLFSNWGELRLGRDYDASFWNLVYDDVNGANGLGQGLNLVPGMQQHRELAGSRQRHDRVPAAGEHRRLVRSGAGVGALEQRFHRQPRHQRSEVLRWSYRLRRRSLRCELLLRRDQAAGIRQRHRAATSTRSGTSAARGTSASPRSMATTTKSSSRLQG